MRLSQGMNKEFKNFMQTRAKACFQHDAAYSDSKDLTKRTAADKVLRDKVYNIANNFEVIMAMKGLWPH